MLCNHGCSELLCPAQSLQSVLPTVTCQEVRGQYSVGGVTNVVGSLLCTRRHAQCSLLLSQILLFRQIYKVGDKVPRSHREPEFELSWSHNLSSFHFSRLLSKSTRVHSSDGTRSSSVSPGPSPPWDSSDAQTPQPEKLPSVLCGQNTGCAWYLVFLGPSFLTPHPLGT